MRRLPDGLKDHPNLQVLLLGKNDMKQLPLTLGILIYISFFKHTFLFVTYLYYLDYTAVLNKNIYNIFNYINTCLIHTQSI